MPRDNQDPVDLVIPEWDYVQKSIQDIIRMSPVTSAPDGNQSDDNDAENEMEVETDVVLNE